MSCTKGGGRHAVEILEMPLEITQVGKTAVSADSGHGQGCFGKKTAGLRHSFLHVFITKGTSHGLAVEAAQMGGGNADFSGQLSWRKICQIAMGKALADEFKNERTGMDATFLPFTQNEHKHFAKKKF